MTGLVVPLHMGALHPLESLFLAALALAPFVVLSVVVTVMSRRDRRAHAQRRVARQATRVDPPRRETSTSTTTDTAAPQSVQQ
jgi:hypothetical protein